MYRQYTQCYTHFPGDKPFNKRDLFSTAAGAGGPGLVAAIFALAVGGFGFVLAFIFLVITYASTIATIANLWLKHRLCCISGDQCAVGTIGEPPTTDTLLGSYDNDNFFDIRVMPHRQQDEYKAPDTSFNASPPGPGPSQDGLTEATPQNDMYLDGFQGTALLKPSITDLPYDTTRSTLHCEAEGSFWKAMLDTAALQGLAVGAGAAVGVAVGAAAGCAIGAPLCGLGCIIGAIIGGLILGLLGSAAAYIAANAAFESDPGDVNDANVGDEPLGALKSGDQVVVFGTHVYDGFHEGWHEIHPLKAIIKATDPKLAGTLPYLEWDPNFPLTSTGPGGMPAADMRKGLASPTFTKAAMDMKTSWCELLREAFDPTTIRNQHEPQNRWTVHPAVDGCTPPAPPPIK
jgi:hypothetical protein